MSAGALAPAVVGWYAGHGRDLPWRRPGTTPWGVLVCEVMSQQTPVARIVEPWQRWLERWPQPAALAAAPPGEAVRQWGRLGYPRRALRLHAAAVAVVDRHGGELPQRLDELLALPGVGQYTAAAVAAFAFGRREVVVDVNVRRVLARYHDGLDPEPGAPRAAELARAAALLPTDPGQAARWSTAVMELGALVCTARSPRCGDCPLLSGCAWAASGRGDEPASARPRTTRPQAWVGTDRYVRGLLLARLRAASDPVPVSTLDTVWHDSEQLARCLASLVDDGLAERSGSRLALPS